MDAVDKFRYGMLALYMLTCGLAVWGTIDLLFNDPNTSCSNIQMIIGHVHDVIDMGYLLLSFVLLIAALNFIQFVIILMTFLEVLRKAYAAFINLTMSGFVLCFVMGALTTLLHQTSSMPVGLYHLIAHFLTENPYEVCLTPKPIEVTAMRVIEFLFSFWVLGVTFGFSAIFTIRFYYLCRLRNERRREVFGLERARTLFEVINDRLIQHELEVQDEFEMPPPPPTYEQTMAMGGAGLPPRYESLDFNIRQEPSNSDE